MRPKIEPGLAACKPYTLPRRFKRLMCYISIPCDTHIIEKYQNWKEGVTRSNIYNLSARNWSSYPHPIYCKYHSKASDFPNIFAHFLNALWEKWQLDSMTYSLDPKCLPSHSYCSHGRFLLHVYSPVRYRYIGTSYSRHSKTDQGILCSLGDHNKILKRLSHY